VHSFKDLPTLQRPGLTVAAVCDRQFPEDCLITAEPAGSVAELPKDAKVGTSSLRRMVQIKRLRPDIEAVPVRGNVPTRLKKLRSGKYDAVIVARAGMERLNLQDKISFCFDPAEFIPAPAQGALAVQTRTDDKAVRELLAAVDDKKTRMVTFAERKVLHLLQCGCRAPAGVFVEIDDDNMTIHAFISGPQGQNFIRRDITGPVADADSLAQNLASKLI
jgi:hydroxymethylbilane synthase